MNRMTDKQRLDWLGKHGHVTRSGGHWTDLTISLTLRVKVKSLRAFIDAAIRKEGK